MKYEIEIDGEKFDVEVKEEKRKGAEREFAVEVGGKEFKVLARSTQPPKKTAPAFNMTVEETASASPAQAKTSEQTADSGDDAVRIVSPMSGKIVRIAVPVGGSVEQGETVIILEAMKMENSIAATMSGKVKSVLVSIGEIVKKGDVLCTIEA